MKGNLPRLEGRGRPYLNQFPSGKGSGVRRSKIGQDNKKTSLAWSVSSGPRSRGCACSAGQCEISTIVSIGGHLCLASGRAATAIAGDSDPKGEARHVPSPACNDLAGHWDDLLLRLSWCRRARGTGLLIRGRKEGQT